MSINNYTIGSIIEKTVPFLVEKGIPNPRLEADLMLAKVLDLPRVKLYALWDRPLDSTELQNYREIILKRVQGWPLAYLTEKKGFLGWDFRISPAVLIPRPETELLVETVVDLVKSKTGEIRGIDVGTGSGIIAIALAKLLPQSSWHAIDISKDALQIASANASDLGVSSQIQFMEGDLLVPFLNTALKFDLIVSNPPYIPDDEMDKLQKEVRKEPVLALDGGKNGLEVYRRFLPQAAALLSEEGVVAVEHGYQQREPLEKIMRELGLSVKSFTDLAGLDRVLVGAKTCEEGPECTN